MLCSAAAAQRVLSPQRRVMHTDKHMDVEAPPRPARASRHEQPSGLADGRVHFSFRYCKVPVVKITIPAKRLHHMVPKIILAVDRRLKY